MKLVVFFLFLSTFVDARRSNKIIGGTERIIQQHPYHTSVQFLGHGICAGSIISEYHILTCASCVIFEKTSLTVFATNLKVLVGTTDIFNILGDGELLDVKHIIWHEQYEPQLFWINDIAILQLEKPIKFSSKRSIIHMPLAPLHHHSFLSMTNWADDIYQTNSYRFLKSIRVKGVSQSNCLHFISNFPLTTKYQGCGKTVSDDDGFNMGDGGVAVIYDNKISGIASVFLPQQPHALIFTKVFLFIDFIDTVMSNY